MITSMPQELDRFVLKINPRNLRWRISRYHWELRDERTPELKWAMVYGDGFRNFIGIVLTPIGMMLSPIAYRGKTVRMKTVEEMKRYAELELQKVWNKKGRFYY